MKIKSALFLLSIVILSFYAFPQPVITSPQSGAVWGLNTTQRITWNPGIYAGPVQLILQENGRNLGFIVRNVPVKAGYYDWRVGQYENANIMRMAGPGRGFTIMIHGIFRNQRFASTSNAFSLSGRSIQVDSPSGIPVIHPATGSVYLIEKPMQVIWDKNSCNRADVKISLFDFNGSLIKYITTRTPNSGVYKWIVENNLPFSKKGYFIRVAAANGYIHGDSGIFNIGIDTTVTTKPGRRKIR